MCVPIFCAFFVAFETYFSHCCSALCPPLKYLLRWSHSEKKNYIPHADATWLIMMIIIRTDCEKPY